MSRRLKNSPPALASVHEDFLRGGSYLRNWSPRTSRTYRQAMEALAKVCPDVPTKPDLDRWVVSMRERGVQPGGCNMYIRTVNSFLSWLHEEGKTPTKLKVRLLSNPPKPLTTFSDTEVRRLLHPHQKVTGAATRTKALVTLLLDTGLRIDEALSLETRNIDWDNLTLRVRGKGNRERLVPISAECRKALWRIHEASKGTPGHLLFRTRSGSKVTYRNTYRDIKVYCEACGVQGGHVHPHSFRHFFATSYLRNGGDIYRLSRILGHTNITTTSLYLRSVGLDQLREAHTQCSPLARLA